MSDGSGGGYVKANPRPDRRSFLRLLPFPNSCLLCHLPYHHRHRHRYPIIRPFASWYHSRWHGQAADSLTRHGVDRQFGMHLSMTATKMGRAALLRKSNAARSLFILASGALLIVIGIQLLQHR